jgi:hypothetical protein
MLLEQFTGGGVGCVMIMIDADADDWWWWKQHIYSVVLSKLTLQ